MSDIATSANKIQAESVQYQAPVSESALSAMGAAINYCLEKLIPVGTVLPSMLTQAQFNAEVGVGYWVIADGSNVAGSRYATVKGVATIPDLRGMYLRGKNNGRVDGIQNPDGDLTLGQYQGDQVKSHVHYIGTDGDYYARSDGGSGGIYKAAGSNNSDPYGGNETRSRNITVNYFIRIN